MTLEMIALIAQFALKYGPDAGRSLAELFQKPAPTLADWNALFDKAKTYEDYAPAIPAPTVV